MKTGIERIKIVFDESADRAEKHFSIGGKMHLDVADYILNYLEGIAFAATMAYKEKMSDYELADEMFERARNLRMQILNKKYGRQQKAR